MPTSRSSARSGPRGGFTLFEVMAALAILALFLLPMVVVRNRSIEAAGDGRFERKAAMLAREKLATLFVEGIQGEGTTTGTFDEDPAYGWDLQVVASEGSASAVDLSELLGLGGTDGSDPATGEPTPPAYWEVTLKITYPSNQGEKEFLVATLVPGPEPVDDGTQPGADAGGGGPDDGGGDGDGPPGSGGT
jgi:prepilin-type N-terminal cleavage/methylation domain-containing protein